MVLISELKWVWNVDWMKWRTKKKNEIFIVLKLMGSKVLGFLAFFASNMLVIFFKLMKKLKSYLPHSKEFWLQIWSHFGLLSGSNLLYHSSSFDLTLNLINQIKYKRKVICLLLINFFTQITCPLKQSPTK